MKVGDRVFWRTRSGNLKPAKVAARIDDDAFWVKVDGFDYHFKMHIDELTPMTKLHKLLAGEENA